MLKRPTIVIHSRFRVTSEIQRNHQRDNKLGFRTWPFVSDIGEEFPEKNPRLEEVRSAHLSKVICDRLIVTLIPWRIRSFELSWSWDFTCGPHTKSLWTLGFFVRIFSGIFGFQFFQGPQPVKLRSDCFLEKPCDLYTPEVEHGKFTWKWWKPLEIRRFRLWNHDFQVKHAIFGGVCDSSCLFAEAFGCFTSDQTTPSNTSPQQKSPQPQTKSQQIPWKHKKLS